MLNRQGYFVTDTERECTNCGVIYSRTSKTVTLCNKCNSERVKAWNTPEDIFIPEKCPYLDIPLVVHTGSSGGKPYSPALDRVDNEKGYIVSNIQVISHLANQMKASANQQQLILFASRVLEIFGKD